MIIPLIIHFILSWLRIYPFETRLILYLSAFVTPFVSIGLKEIIAWLNLKIHKYAVTLILVGLLVVMPGRVVRKFPYRKEEIKECFDFIKKNKTTKKEIYVYSGAGAATEYYKKTDRVPATWTIIHGAGSEPDSCISEILKMKGEIWLLFSHIRSTINGEDDEYILKTLITKHHVTSLKNFITQGSSVYLVKLNDMDEF